MTSTTTGPHDDTVTLWRPTGREEIDLVAESGWRSWPPRLPEQPIFYPVLNEWYATKITREWNVPAGGSGHVTRFDVQREFLRHYGVHQVGGRDVLEYWIPSEDLTALNANIVGAIRETALYLGPVPDDEFTAAERALGRPLPAPWHDYLRGRSWLRRGALGDGDNVRLTTPLEGVDALEAWERVEVTHPGMAIIGRNGADGHLALDLRKDPAPVLLVRTTDEGWHDATPLADDTGALVERVEAGTLRLR